MIEALKSNNAKFVEILLANNATVDGTAERIVDLYNSASTSVNHLKRYTQYVPFSNCWVQVSSPLNNSSRKLLGCDKTELDKQSIDKIIDEFSSSKST